MEEQQRKDTDNKKRILQQISVPFLWEDKPGIPKKEWSPSTAPQLQTIAPPWSTSPVGSSFLEQLFPLYTPKPDSPRVKGLRGADERSIVTRRPQMLGDLIMLSRRRSYLHKAVIMRKNTVSKELDDPNANGCCMFGSGHGGIAKLLGGKGLLTLNFA